MSDITIEELKLLRDAAVDSRRQYRREIELAKGDGLTPLFETMVALHSENAAELEDELARRGAPVGDGPLVGALHRMIVDLRTMLGGSEASLLSGVIESETRSVVGYDEALAQLGEEPSLGPLLRTQRERLAAELELMTHAERAIHL